MDIYIFIYLFIFVMPCYANQIQMIFQPTHLIICKLPILHAWCQNVRTDIGSFLGDVMATSP
jgi:predicted ABC-type exoprotein transport system permease subunit